MALFIKAGRIEISRILKERFDADPTGTLVAYGTGPGWWGKPQVEQVTFNPQDEAQLTYPISASAIIQVRSQDNAVLYTSDDYSVDPSGKITRIPTGSIVEATTVTVSYTADVPAPDRASITLINEVGRCRITGVDYVEPLEDATDPDARFVTVGVDKFAFADVPTERLLIRSRLADGDAVGDDITEYGLFMGCEVDGLLPVGQPFYTPDQVTQKGTLLIAQTRTPVPHDGTIGLDTAIVFEI